MYLFIGCKLSLPLCIISQRADSVDSFTSFIIDAVITFGIAAIGFFILPDLPYLAKPSLILTQAVSVHLGVTFETITYLRIVEVHRTLTSPNFDWNELTVPHRPSGLGPKLSKSFSIGVSTYSQFNTHFITRVDVRRSFFPRPNSETDLPSNILRCTVSYSSTSHGVRLVLYFVFLSTGWVQCRLTLDFSNSYWLKSFNSKPAPVPGKSYTVGQINLRESFRLAES